MIIVADSGSTKCDWVAINKDGFKSEKMSTMGFNPFFHSSSFITNKLNEHEDLSMLAKRIEKVFFYGAGCSSELFKKIITEGLQNYFVNAEITVDHDLAGAVYATCGNEEGIACILGTGSNSCYFDGTNIYEEVPALGYILGDEGSGAYFGRQLLKLYLYKELPPHISKAFEDRFNTNKQEIFERVYMKEHANVYLASFMRFLSDTRDDEWVRKFIYKGFSEFITIHVWKYKNFKEVPIHFIGSVAFYFQDLLKHEAKIHHLNVGKIIKQPVHNLTKYHLSEV